MGGQLGPLGNLRSTGPQKAATIGETLGLSFVLVLVQAEESIAEYFWNGERKCF